MTAPAVPLGRILSPDEFEAQQFAPTMPTDPKKPGGLTRVLTLDEFEQAQRAPDARSLKIPALPTIAPKDAVAQIAARPTAPKREADQDVPWALKTAPEKIAGAIRRQVLRPALENPMATVATALAGGAAPAVVGTLMGADMATNIAQYGYQTYLEHHATPEQRKEMLADPDRTSGEAAAVQAAMLGMGALIHVGVKGYQALDVSEGLMGDAAKAAQADAAYRFRPGFNDAHKNADFAAMMDQGAERTGLNQEFGVQADRPKGFTPTAEKTPRVAAQPVEGMVVPETPKVGKVAPLPTEAPSEPLAQQADLANTITEGLSDFYAKLPKRRAKENAPMFETEPGAQVLGAAAGRHDVPLEANPYHPESPLAEAWTEGHNAATESYGHYPDGFSMGGALNENRIPADYKAPKAPGFEPTALPEGVSAESIALADALKPSRFRRHTTDELINAAIDTQARLEQAQSRAASGAFREVSSERGKADLENRATNIAEHYENSTATAEKEIARAQSAMQQIEREAALRGITGDELAQRIDDAKAARLERQAASEEASLNFAFGEEPTAETPTSGLRAIAGDGAERQRALSRGVLQRAIANGLEVDGAPSTYRVSTQKVQAEMAAQLVTENPAMARKVAMGEANAPGDLLPEFVYIAMENKAIAEGDVATLRELASSVRTEEATTMGQRIAALATRDPESPVRAMADVAKAREARLGNAKELAAKVSAELSKQLDGITIEPAKLKKFIDDITCY